MGLEGWGERGGLRRLCALHPTEPRSPTEARTPQPTFQPNPGPQEPHSPTFQLAIESWGGGVINHFLGCTAMSAKAVSHQHQYLLAVRRQWCVVEDNVSATSRSEWMQQLSNATANEQPVDDRMASAKWVKI